MYISDNAWKRKLNSHESKKKKVHNVNASRQMRMLRPPGC
jgi:hypothetical protein